MLNDRLNGGKGFQFLDDIFYKRLEFNNDCNEILLNAFFFKCVVLLLVLYELSEDYNIRLFLTKEILS